MMKNAKQAQLDLLNKCMLHLPMEKFIHYLFYSQNTLPSHRKEMLGSWDFVAQFHSKQKVGHVCIKGGSSLVNHLVNQAID